jgi:hypothetical protein
MALLKIRLVPGAEDVLAGFPFLPDQYIELEKEDEVVINLGKRADTTLAQEQFLNSSRDVVSWDIVNDDELTPDEALELLIHGTLPDMPLGEPVGDGVGPYGPRWLITPRNQYPLFAMRHTWCGSYGYELWRQDAPGEPLRLVKTACGFKREHEARDAAEAEAFRLMSQAQ